MPFPQLSVVHRCSLGPKDFLWDVFEPLCVTRCSVTLGIALVGQMTFPDKLRSVVHVIDTCHCCVSFSLGSGQAFWGCPEDMPRVNHVSDERFILFHHPAPGRPTQPKCCQLRLLFLSFPFILDKLKWPYSINGQMFSFLTEDLFIELTYPVPHPLEILDSLKS